MDKQVFDLNGTWRLAYCPIGEGTPEKCAALPHMAYQVPGDVHTPLMDAGLITDPLYARNSLDCRWVEEQEFWCERRFTLTAQDLKAHMTLTFEGLDTTADIWLNGGFLGRHNNAFVEIEYDAKPFLREGENVLLVRLDQGLREAQTHDLERMGMMWNNEQPWRAWMRKPQFVYGWDWTIWLASCGIWKDVYLTAYDTAAIADLYAVVAQDAVAEGQPCRVNVQVAAEGGAQAECLIRDAQGGIVAQGAPGELTIPEAHLWWCNGLGEAYLYTVEATLTDAAGEVLDRRVQRLGVRTIALTEPDLGDGGTGFTFVLNGQPVFCKGANHVPCDCLPGRITPDKERALIALARDEHMNMLRVWGGGVYASEALMDACDEMGVMVWHDFMYACGYHPDHDAGFVENITVEAEKAIRRLRRHTSLIGWAGNNEIQEMYGSQKQWNPDLPFYGQSIYEKLLPEACARLCPTLIYRPSSPYGGSGQADGKHGDQHIWLLTHVPSHPNYLDLWRFTDFEVKFLSEFGIMGAMPLETAQACIPAESLRPDDPTWIHHTNCCMEGTLLHRMVGQYFGDWQHLSADQFILRSQAAQAELTRHMYEEFRRQKFVCSGLLFWTLSDSYGVHNWSLIDHALRRKPIYYALRHAQAPLALAICGWGVQTKEGRESWRGHWAQEPGRLILWGMNDTLTDASARLEWTLLTRSGEVLKAGVQDVQLPANRSVQLAEVALDGIAFDPAQTVFRARLWQGTALVNETRYFFAPMQEMAKQQPTVAHTCRRISGDEYEVALTSDAFVWMLHLREPDGTVWAENDFDLWPGETKTVRVRATQPDFRPEYVWMKEDRA